MAITFFGKPDPDDPRGLREQALEQIEALSWMLADIGAGLDVLGVGPSTERRGGDGR